MQMHIASHWACLDYWRWLPLKMLSEWLESIPVSWGYKTKQAKTKLTKTTLLFKQELVRLHTAPALLGVGAVITKLDFSSFPWLGGQGGF